ncbi:AzlC family ABC transporter permease [Cumulibacter soli]|uniref:AzlC family ABC transporter permease n=1 Tax=Cumulibacter soli TaxID=2546344 RepID=UPI001FBA42D4|nr:AzlC family ABC transporter permease [Cumulibacter soli]
MSPASELSVDDEAGRRRVVRNALAMGLATGAYGLTFGALGVASGLSLAQTCILSLAMFTGGSQFAFVGVIGGGGTPLAAAATALLLGARNTVYGLSVGPLLRVRGWRKAGAAQLVIDESTAMSIGETRKPLARVAFWATGLSIFAFWNLATLIGAVAAGALPDPKALGLDAVAPAAFIFLFAPRLTSRTAWLTAGVGAVVALALVPLLPSGLPVIAAAVAVAVLAIATSRRATGPDHSAGSGDAS